MTPQLQQAIRLLQMSASELSEELQLAHETNPLLEIKEEGDQDETTSSQQEDSFDDSLDERQTISVLNEESAAMGLDADTIEVSGIEQLQFEQSVEYDPSTWDDPQNYAPIDQRRPSGATSQSFDRPVSDFVIPEETSTLRETLGTQAIFLFDDEGDRRIAHHLIQNINEAGYLDVPLDEIQQTLNERKSVRMHDVEKVLDIIQKLEPAGVGARNPRECLMIQLQARDKKLPGYQTSYEIVESHLALLANKEFGKLRKVLGVSEKVLGTAVELIQQLSPHPGYSVGNANVDYIVPDILVEKKGKNWFANINLKAIPGLVINQDYQKLISKNSNAEFGAMKQQLQHARWLLGNLEKRQYTIHSVAKEIVERQQDFFHFGAEKMRPLTLNDIATPLSIHESTVSRATTGKYLSAPQGIFELKYFFSSRVSNDQGEGISSIAIQSEIKRIIQNEPSGTPISDEKIGILLSEKGYKVARRTVAKYREKMNIPSSSRRKTI